MVTKNIIFLISKIYWPQGDGDQDIQTSNLHFMRQGPKLIVLVHIIKQHKC